MTLIAIIVVLFLVSVIAVVWKTEQLNVDPLQDALVMLVMELISDGNTPEARHRFSELAAAHFHRFNLGQSPSPKLRLRLLHALSTLVNGVSAAEFKEAERFLQKWEMPVYRPEHRAISDTVRRTLSGSADIFISYAREDQGSIRIIVAQLEAAGFSVWWDDGIHVGARWDAEINRQLSASRAVVVLWSPYSSVSEWVRREAGQAKANEKIVPALIRRCRLPSGFSDIQTIDLTRWDGDAADAEWQKLMSAVTQLSGVGLPRSFDS